jgi:hypothetical protein
MRICDTDLKCERLVAVQFGPSIILEVRTRVSSEIYVICAVENCSAIVLVTDSRYSAMSGLVPRAKVKTHKGLITTFSLALEYLLWLVYFMLRESRRLCPM